MKLKKLRGKIPAGYMCVWGRQNANLVPWNSLEAELVEQFSLPPCLPALDIAIELRAFTGLEPILATKSNL